VESACAMLQQEELQREVLSGHPIQVESAALLSEGAANLYCSVYGNRGHNKEKCWQVIGYPSWHPKSKKFPQKKGGKGLGGQKPGEGQGYKPNRPRENEPRIVNKVEHS